MVSCVGGRFYITAVKLAIATAEEVTLARVPSPLLLALCVSTALCSSSQMLQKRTHEPNEFGFGFVVWFVWLFFFSNAT